MKPAGYIKEWAKTLSGTVLILLFLKVTGLLGSVVYATQSALLKTGLMDATASELKTHEAFDYNFSVRDVNNNPIQFSQYKGKVIFINLWATWCGPCRAEMADIQKLYDQVDHNKIQFIMLSLDKEKDKEAVMNFIQKRSFSFPVFMTSGYLTEQLNVPSIPTTFVISKEGKIAAKEIGTTNFNTNKFRKFLEQLTEK